VEKYVGGLRGGRWGEVWMMWGGERGRGCEGGRGRRGGGRRAEGGGGRRSEVGSGGYKEA